MKKNLFDLILVCCLLQACVSNVDLEMPLQKSIVLNGLLVPGDTISVSLHRSGTNTDTTSFLTIKNAEVTLFENGNNMGQLQYRNKGIYFSSIIAKELCTYKIEVETPEREKAWAETTVPEASFGVTINSTDENTTMNYGGKYNLTIVDNPDRKNFYWVCNERTSLSYDSIITKSLAHSIYSNSPYIDKFNVTYDPEGNGTSNFDYSYSIHLDDADFNGTTISIDFNCGGSYGVKQENMLVFNVDEHYSAYLKSKIINEEGGDYISEKGPPISYQPAFLYTNVHGGMGILGSYTTYTKTYQYK